MLAARSSRTILPNSPSRTTVTVVSSLISFSASNALALRPSITTVMVTDRAMAKKMPTHSRMSVWPPAMERVIDAQGDGRSDHKHDKHRVSGRLPVGRGHMFLSRLVDTTH